MESIEQFDSPFPRPHAAPLYYVKATQEFTDMLCSTDGLRVQIDLHKRAFLVTYKGASEPTLFYFDTQNMNDTGNDMVCSEGTRNGKCVRGCGQVHERFAIRPLGTKPPLSVDVESIPVPGKPLVDVTSKKMATAAEDAKVVRSKGATRKRRVLLTTATTNEGPAVAAPLMSLHDLVLKILAKGPRLIKEVLREISKEKRLTNQEINDARNYIREVCDNRDDSTPCELKPEYVARVNVDWYNENNLPLVKKFVRSLSGNNKIAIDVANKFGVGDACGAETQARGESGRVSVPSAPNASAFRTNSRHESERPHARKGKRPRSQVEDDYDRVYKRFHEVYPQYQEQYSILINIQRKFERLKDNLKAINKSDKAYDDLKREISREYKKSKDVIAKCSTKYAEYGDTLNRLKNEAQELKGEIK